MFAKIERVSGGIPLRPVRLPHEKPAATDGMAVPVLPNIVHVSDPQSNSQKCLYIAMTLFFHSGRLSYPMLDMVGSCFSHY